jgi:hypothetical protein
MSNWPQWCTVQTMYILPFQPSQAAIPEKYIWIYWSRSNSWIYFYLVLNKNWKIYWPEQSFTCLGLDDRCSSWGLRLFWSRWVVSHNDVQYRPCIFYLLRTLMVDWALYSISCCLQFLWNVYIITYSMINALTFYLHFYMLPLVTRRWVEIMNLYFVLL